MNKLTKIINGLFERFRTFCHGFQQPAIKTCQIETPPDEENIFITNKTRPNHLGLRIINNLKTKIFMFKLLTAFHIYKQRLINLSIYVCQQIHLDRLYKVYKIKIS